jgi:two-component system cell cycle sensor histidine kinase/response regulator CckA
MANKDKKKTGQVPEEAFRALVLRYEALLSSIPDIVMEIDVNKVYTWTNDAGKQFFGDDIVGKETDCYFEGEQDTHGTVSPLSKGAKDIIYVESWHKRRDGKKRLLGWWYHVLRGPDGNVSSVVSTARDITERKRIEQEKANLEEQLRQSQKMEAIGRLAGGIAHDFNNLLTIMKGYSQISLIELNENNPIRENIEEIRKASQRAADLTRQLLAFSRRQIMEMRVLDLNIVLRNLDKMLRRIIGEDIELVTLLAEDLGKVKTDPGQMEQIIMNLAVNARDAMPKGGKLTIETANVILDEEYARTHVAVTPGQYVMLSLSDQGLG